MLTQALFPVITEKSLILRVRSEETYVVLFPRSNSFWGINEFILSHTRLEISRTTKSMSQETKLCCTCLSSGFEVELFSGVFMTLFYRNEINEHKSDEKDGEF